MRRVLLIFIPLLLAGQADWSQLLVRGSFIVDQKIQEYDFTNELFEIVKEIKLDENNTVKDILSPDLRDEIITVLKRAKTKKVSFLTNGTKEVLLEFPITGRILSLLVPKQYEKGKPVVQRYCPLCGQRWPSDRPVPSGIDLVIKDEIEKIYTGIILDCSKFNPIPALFPKVFDESGKLVYGLSFTKRGHIVESGLLVYTKSDDEIMINRRAGNHPLKIKPIRVEGSNIIISNSDAKMMHGSKRNIQLLEQCRVIVISGQH